MRTRILSSHQHPDQEEDNMEPEPITLVIAIPLLIGLGALRLVRRYRQKFEQEKKWEKEQKKYRYKDWRY